MRKAHRKPCSKAKNDADFKRNRCCNPRAVPIRVGPCLQGIPVKGRELGLPEEHREIARLLNPVAIEYNGKIWRKDEQSTTKSQT